MIEVILIASTTIDGKIAKGPHDYVNWTSKEDKQNFARKTKEAGVVIMGFNTFKTLPKPLPERLNVVMAKEPQRMPEQEGVMFVDKDLPIILRMLEERGFTRAYVIGGTATYTTFLKEKLAHLIDVTIEPKIFGEGFNFFGEIGETISCRLVSQEMLNNNTINIIYRMEYK